MNVVVRLLATLLMLLLAATPAVSYALACVVDGRAQPMSSVSEAPPAVDAAHAFPCPFANLHPPPATAVPGEQAAQSEQPGWAAGCCAIVALSPPSGTTAASGKEPVSSQLSDDTEAGPSATAAPPATLAIRPRSPVARCTGETETRPAFAHAGTRTYLATARLRL